MEQEKKQIEQLELEPLVEVLKFSQINNGDVILMRCEPGKENEEIKNIHSCLKSLIFEKDLKILAVNPDQDFKNLFYMIEAVKHIEQYKSTNAD